MQTTPNTMMRSSDWASIEQRDDNMLVRLGWESRKESFLQYLESQTSTIENIVRHHLSLSRHQLCTITARDFWISGTFNVCIPVSIAGSHVEKLMFRCPLPHRFDQTNHTPSTLEEKIRCEAASMAWISKHCPNVPIPRLWGVGLPCGLNVCMYEPGITRTTAYELLVHNPEPYFMVSAHTRVTLRLLLLAVARPCVASLPGCQNSLVALFWLPLDGLHMRRQGNCPIGNMASTYKTTEAELHEEFGGHHTRFNFTVGQDWGFHCA